MFQLKVNHMVVDPHRLANLNLNIKIFVLMFQNVIKAYNHYYVHSDIYVHFKDNSQILYVLRLISNPFRLLVPDKRY